jgi:hypothetical protein
MASDAVSVTNPTTSLVHGSQAPKIELLHAGGNTLPQNGRVTAVPAAAPQPAAVQKPVPASTAAEQQAAQQKSDLASQVGLLNKYLNDSGRPAQFRASSNNKQIEEVNPATGEVIAVYSATIFAELARSVGISGVLVNSHA